MGLLPAGDPRFIDEFRSCRYSIFRFEGLAVYRGSGEDEQIAAFERGDPSPPPHPKRDDWEAMIRAHRAAGRVMQRVHAVAEPLSDYLRFELAWAYPPNIRAGEDVRIVDATGGWPEWAPRRDFHLFDNSRLFDAHYAADGTWLGVELITDPTRTVAACRWRDALWHHAVPWSEYLRRHPDLAARVCVAVE